MFAVLVCKTEMIVSDGGKYFSSQEFKEFVDKNGINHTGVSPYHHRNRNRNTPQSVTGHPPAEMMFGRKLKTRLSRLQPDLSVKVEHYQEK